MVLSMLIFGGPTLHYFALALTIGILFGIYSSVFVAAAIAMWLGVKREDLVKTGPKEHRPERSERRGRGVESADIPTTDPPAQPPWSPAPHSRPWPARPGGCTPKNWSRAWRRWCRTPARRPSAPARQTVRARRCSCAGATWCSTCMKRRAGLAPRHGRRPAQRAAATACRPRAPASTRRPAAAVNTLSLVDDDTIELEIMTSRLALAIMDRASWEFTDLRSRIVHLEQRDELEPHDLLRAHVLARIVVDAWRGAGLHAGRTGASCSRCCTRSSRTWSRRPTTRPTAGWSSARCCPTSTCGPSSAARATRPTPVVLARQRSGGWWLRARQFGQPVPDRGFRLRLGPWARRAGVTPVAAGKRR